jgi:hypothetical protein
MDENVNKAIIIIGFILAILHGIDTFKEHKGMRVKVGFESMDRYTGSIMSAATGFVGFCFIAYIIVAVVKYIFTLFS